MIRLTRPVLFGLLGAVLVAALAGAWAFWRLEGKAASPELITAVLAVRTVESKPVFFTAFARKSLAAVKPGLLAAGDGEEQSERAVEFARALQDPRVFRQLDRRERFDTLLLAGDVSTFRPLLEHLIETQDFSLVYLDHTSLVFRRAPVKGWRPEDFEAVRQKFAGRPAWEQAEFLAQAAGRLLAVNQPALAKACLDEALAKDGKSVAAWTQSGYYCERVRQWDEALTDADTALGIDEDYEPAMVLRAQALFATKRYDVAYGVTKKLVEISPRDPSILFLHARIAHQARAFQGEIAALKTLIELAEQAGQPTGGYQIYLGQAYASAGDAQGALAEFEKVLGDGALTVEQREYVLDSVNRIRSRLGAP